MIAKQTMHAPYDLDAPIPATPAAPPAAALARQNFPKHIAVSDRVISRTRT